MEKKTTIKLGSRVMVSDPCYKPGTWCQGVLENVLEGNWNAEVRYGKDPFGSSKERPHALIAHHESFMEVEPTEECDFEVGVDSGMAGIFDEAYFNEIKLTEEKANKWYDRVCDRAYISVPNPDYKDMKTWLKEDKKVDLDEYENLPVDKQSKYIIEYMDSNMHNPTMYTYNMVNTDDRGCSTETAYGDGGYTCFVGRNDDGKIVSIMIDFVGPDWDEDEDLHDEEM